MSAQGIMAPGTNRNSGGRRGGDNSIDERLTEYLLRTGARPSRVQRAKSIAADLDLPYSSVTAHLRRLVQSDRAALAYMVNPYRTRFCHEYRIGLQVDVHRLRRAHEQRGGDESGNPVDWFLHRLVDVSIEEPSLAPHLIVTDVTMLHGAGSDVEITTLTDDGIFSVGRYVREVLAAEPFIVQCTTQTVSWRYCFEGFCGQNTDGRSSRDEDPSGSSGSNGDPDDDSNE